MNIYVFDAAEIQSLPLLIDFRSGKERQLSVVLQITFRNYFLDDYDAWDKHTEGEILIEKIVDTSTQKVLNYEKLPFIAQLDIRCRCYGYLRSNHLLRYPNVIPFQSLPYRMPSLLKNLPNHTAKILLFPRIERKISKQV